MPDYSQSAALLRGKPKSAETLADKAESRFDGKRLLRDLREATLGDDRTRQQASLSSEKSQRLEKYKTESGRQMAGSAAAP